MWRIVETLRKTGVTIILTTHYIEEAEEISDRVGIINDGKLLLVDDKTALMHELGKKQLEIEFKEKIAGLPENLMQWDLELSNDGTRLTYTYDTQARSTGITLLLQAISDAGLSLKDLKSKQSSLEEIFVDLVKIES
jgi:ABC-2 type transport system ATP-binding protein